MDCGPPAGQQVDAPQLGTPHSPLRSKTLVVREVISIISSRMMRSFSILKDRAKVKVSVTRDSVSAADDVTAPNKKRIVIGNFTETEDFIRAVAIEYGVPSIQGGRATWEVILNDQKIGVIAQEWQSPRATVSEVSLQDDNHVFLRYHAQADPETVI